MVVLTIVDQRYKGDSNLLLPTHDICLYCPTDYGSEKTYNALISACIISVKCCPHVGGVLFMHGTSAFVGSLSQVLALIQQLPDEPSVVVSSLHHISSKYNECVIWAVMHLCEVSLSHLEIEFEHLYCHEACFLASNMWLWLMSIQNKQHINLPVPSPQWTSHFVFSYSMML